MLVVVRQAGQKHQGWPYVDVISKEIGWLCHSQVFDAGSDNSDKGSRNLRLNIAVVPGVAGKHGGR